MLKKLLEIDDKKGICISIIGSGGKTSLMKNLSNELKLSKTLVSTTTKLGLNQIKDFDFEIEGRVLKAKKGITFNYLKKDLAIEKIIGHENKYFETLKGFDYIILESDGSKQKFLKGWNDYEPSIPSNTTHTIGVINLKLVGQPMNLKNIHRLDEFLKITEKKELDLITNNDIQNIINKALFKKSIGEKILFINMIDTDCDKKICQKFLKNAKINTEKIIYGSLKNKKYYEWG